jgi:hypothetical protein
MATAWASEGHPDRRQPVRPLCSRSPVSRPGWHSHTGRGEAPNRYTGPKGSCRSDVGLRSECRTALVIRAPKGPFEADCLARNTEPTHALADLLGEDGDPDELWKKVKTNLQAGKVRLLFVADRIPPEVKGIVEFLNRQMDPAEVLAIELRQYEGEGLRTIVPAVYGHTEEAQQRKGTGDVPKRFWDEVSVFEELRNHVHPELVPVAQRIANWIKTASDEVVFGRGAKYGSIGAAFRRNGSRFIALRMYSSGVVDLNFGDLKPPFDDPGLRQGWVDRIRALSDLKLPPDVGSKWPNIRLASLVSQLDAFLGVMDWVASSVKQNRPS